ncbi:Uncharacterised protein [Mycobacterium tuberculosis]|nr:Uncharacterised protein [Mycobacterium tuberculosis]CNY04725.1 Uncharacterised protein [Mycobacterium tuberculosis]
MQAGGGGESRYLDILVTVADGSQGDRADSVLAGDAWMLVAFWPIPASVPALRSIMASTRQHPGVSDVICDRGAGRVGGGRGGSSADRFGSECGGAVRRACPGVSGGGGAGSGVSRAVCAPIERGSDIVCGYRGDHRDVAPGGAGLGARVRFRRVPSVRLWSDSRDRPAMDQQPGRRGARPDCQCADKRAARPRSDRQRRHRDGGSSQRWPRRFAIR